MSNNNKTPAIRFKGFTDTWEQRKLGDMCDEFQSGKSIKASDITDSGEYAVYGGNGFRGYTDTYNHDGDYALIGRQGALCGNMNFSSGKAYFTEHAIAVHGNADNDTLFLYYLLDLMNLGQYSGQSAQPGLAVNKIIQLKTKAPKLDEQRLISSFFKQLDSLITLYQRKYDKLIQFKAAMLQKMFPQNGADKPEIRFKGFTDAWEQRKVGEVSESYSGGTPSVGVKEYYGGQIPFIRSAEINSEITELFLTEEGLKNSSARLVAVGDILYALYGATSGEVGRARLKGAINQAILAIKPHTDYDSEYLAQWLRKSKHSIIKIYLQGGQGNLSGTIVKELSVDFPSLKEQRAIGDFFRQLDNLITFHQRKCDKYKSIKSGLIRKLFP